MTTTNYEQQASNFLAATNTQFITEFLEFGKMDNWSDGHNRNVFKITLKNDLHKYSFKFGSSLKDSLKNSNDVIYETEIDFYLGFKYEGLKNKFFSYPDKISIEAIKEEYINGHPKNLLDRAKATTIYNDFVKANTNKRITRINIISLPEWLDKLEGAIIRKCSELKAKNFGEGVQAETVQHPTAYDVLACIEKYEVTDFEDFCSNYGYDIDSRKAYKTYKAVKREWENVNKLFSSEELELLRDLMVTG